MANLADLTQDGGNAELQYFDNPPAPIVEPLDGYATVDQVMDRFPEEVYNKSRDSHLYRFIAALAGDSGAGILKKQSYIARLKSEGGLLTFKDLDTQYTQVFRFPRLPSEQYTLDIDPEVDSLTQDQWNQLQFQDEQYYARVKLFFNATRLGNSPEGIRMAAEAGSGVPVDVIENYKAAYDLLSDDPLGLEFVGQTNSIHEFVVLPRVLGTPIGVDDPNSTTYTAAREQFAQQGVGGTYATMWAATHSYTVGDIVYPTNFNGHYYVVTAQTGNSGVTEPPFASNVEGQTFVQGNVTYQDIGVSVDDYFYTGTLVNSNAPATSSVTRFDPARERNMAHILDSIRPVGALMTIQLEQAHHTKVAAAHVRASSSRFSMERYVTGRTDVQWPAVDSKKNYWIVGGVENQATRLPVVGRSNPVIWQTVDNVHAYTEEAITDPDYGTADFYGALPFATYDRYRSQHVGPSQGTFQLIFPFLQNAPSDDVFSPDKALALQSTPLVIEKGHK